MAQKSGPEKEPAEQVIKEIRRATWRQFFGGEDRQRQSSFISGRWPLISSHSAAGPSATGRFRK
jgi:hypothetical protein